MYVYNFCEKDKCHIFLRSHIFKLITLVILYESHTYTRSQKFLTL